MQRLWQQAGENSFNGLHSCVFCVLCALATGVVWGNRLDKDGKMKPDEQLDFKPVHVTYAAAVYAGYIVAYKLVWGKHAFDKYGLKEPYRWVQLYALALLGFFGWPAVVMRVRTILEE